MITCTKCSNPASHAIGAPTPVTCPRCNSPLLVEAFPRLLSGVAEEHRAEPITSGDQASCYYHPENRAEVPCDGCGRYLCAVCDLKLDDRHLCPSCLEHDRGTGLSHRLLRDRVLWDSIVLSLAVLPIFIIYCTVIGAPLAVAIGIRHFKTPTSLLPRSRIRLYLGLAIASIQIVAWLWVFGALLMGVWG